MSAPQNSLDLDYIVPLVWRSSNNGAIPEQTIFMLLSSYMHGFWKGRRCWSDTITPKVDPPINIEEFGRHLPLGFALYMKRWGFSSFEPWQERKLREWADEIIERWEA